MKRTEFSVTVISIPKRFPGQETFSGEEEVHEFLEKIQIPHLRFDFNDQNIGLGLLVKIKPQIIFRQGQWDADIPDAYSPRNLTFARLCYISYEIMNIIQNIQRSPDIANSALDSAWHRACWRIFIANELVLRQAEKDTVTHGSQFSVTGHPKVDRLLESTPRWPENIERQTGLRIVWSAHHSVDATWSQFGLFPKVWGEMLNWARQSPQDSFLFSPHPALLTRMHSENDPFLTPENVDHFWNEWNSLPNTAVLLPGTYKESAQASDVLICDGISMLLEYTLLKKPVIFLENPHHVPFNEIGDILLQACYRAETVSEAREVCEKISSLDGDPLLNQRTKVNEILFPAELRNAGKRIVDLIQDELLPGRS